MFLTQICSLRLGSFFLLLIALIVLKNKWKFLLSIASKKRSDKKRGVKLRANTEKDEEVGLWAEMDDESSGGHQDTTRFFLSLSDSYCFYAKQAADCYIIFPASSSTLKLVDRVVNLEFRAESFHFLIH